MTTTISAPTAATHPDLPGIIGEFFWVTPEIAKDWLENYNTNNRTIKAKHAENITRDMQEDLWIFNGATMSFYADNPEGNENPHGRILADGQHRLEGIVNSGEAQLLFVWHGIDERARPTIDDNKSRTAADDVAMMGIKYDREVAALAGRVFGWKRRGGIGRIIKATKSEVQVILKQPDCKNIPDIAAWSVAARKYNGPGLQIKSAGIGTARWILLSESNPDAVEWFFERFLDGAGLPKNHPIMNLRRKFLNQSTPGERLTEEEQAAFLILCWNAIMSGNDRERFNRRGKNEATFAAKPPQPVVMKGHAWRGLLGVPPPPLAPAFADPSEKEAG